MALPPRDKRHQYLRYEELQYNDADIVDFEMRLANIYRRDVHRVQGQSMFTSQAWRRLFEIRGPLVYELIVKFFSTFRLGEIPDKEDLSAYWIRISPVGEFFGTPPSYTLIRDPMLRLCHRLIACSITGRSQALEKVTVTNLFYLRGMDVDSVNVPYLLARYLRLFPSGRKHGAMISGGQYVARLADHFGLLTEERLQGLTMIVQELPVIDMAEFPDAAAGAPKAADEDAPIADEGAPAVPAPVQAPQSLPHAVGLARTMAKRLAKVEEDVPEIRGALGK
nr:hypothetical protein [Tanacetum cinerariifolium]